jgi:hypothetical protein
MPYELSFTKRVEIADRDLYVNGCCIGGDAVAAALRPALQARHGNADTGQEDWAGSCGARPVTQDSWESYAISVIFLTFL